MRQINQLVCLCVCLQEECQNYIRVLLISGRMLFTCGTNAFTPVCITRQVGTTVHHEMLRSNQNHPNIKNKLVHSQACFKSDEMKGNQQLPRKN